MLNNDSKVGLVSGAVASSTGLMGWFDVHAAGIGAICTLVTVVIYAGMAVRSIYKDRNAEKRGSR